MNGTVVAIYTTATGGTPLTPVDEVVLEAGKGLVGDRYFEGSGTFSDTGQHKRESELTLIEEEEIARFNAQQGLTLGAGELRRNLITRGIRLNELVGKRFRIGPVELEGVRLCEPCAYLAKTVNSAVLPGLVHRAGLRASIVSGGCVKPGDRIAL
jgi:MOSC domain-containing protein YiiM